MRILPLILDGVNEEWLADRSRFLWVGLRRQRLDRPYIRRDGKLNPASWAEAFAAITAQKGKRAAILAGDLVSTEALFAAKLLADSFGDSVECRTDGAALPTGNRSACVGTARIEDLEAAGRVLLVGTNPRAEAPVLNARIRKGWLRGADVALVGEPADLTYPVRHLGTGPDALRKAREDASGDVPTLVVVGQTALRRSDGAAVLADAMALAEASGGGLLVLHTAASRVGAMDIGFTTEGGLNAALDGAEVIYALGVDETDLPAGPFVIYQGSHGDRGAHRADVILPGAAWTEESGIFVNTEGRPQMANRAGFPPGDARENWALLRALSAELGKTLPFNSLAELRSMMFDAVPHLAMIDAVPENAWAPLPAGDIDPSPFGQAVPDHYLTNPILRASSVMGELSRLAAERTQPLAAE